jgi:uncharacterized protein YjiS (DUF1127 family)
VKSSWNGCILPGAAPVGLPASGLMKRRTAMTTLDHSTTAIHSATRPALVTRAKNAVSTFYRSWKNRREFYHLGNMSDAELADIGLTRADLHVAVRSPFDFDPTGQLNALAQARAEASEDAARRVC